LHFLKVNWTLFPIYMLDTASFVVFQLQIPPFRHSIYQRQIPNSFATQVDLHILFCLRLAISMSHCSGVIVTFVLFLKWLPWF
jgi:hypothetical protein